MDTLIDIATLVGAITAIIALCYTAYQVRQNTRISAGQFWLELEKMFAQHDEVHLALRPGGPWSQPGTGPATPEEWVRMEDYMGLFEHCEIMLDKGLIDEDTFREIFSYRLKNLVRNTRIREAKLCHPQRRSSWKRLLALLQRLQIAVPCP